MTNTVIFDGHDLGKLLVIKWEIDEEILPAVTDRTIVVGESAGAKFISRQIGIRKITVPYAIKEATQDKRQELTTILNVTEPKKLEFTDRPGTYYMAIPDGNISYGKKGFIDESTISFICSDPYRYAENVKTFPMADDGSITINNTGNMPVPVSFEMATHAETAYVGFANEDGVIQVGNPAEADELSVNETFTAINNSFNSVDEMTKWTANKYKPQYPYNNELTGTMAIAAGTKKDNMVHVNNYKNGTVGGMWYGASIYRPFETDKLGHSTFANWKVKTLVGSNYGTDKSLGAQELMITDASGKSIAGFRFRKLSYSRNMTLYFFVGNTIFKQWEGNTDWFLKDFLGNIEIEKNGADFRFSINNQTTKVGGVYHFVDNSLANTLATGVNYWVGKIDTRPGIKDQLFWVNVQTSSNGFVDVRNQFQDGDNLVVEVTDEVVRNNLNGLPRYDQQMLGSVPIIAPPGESLVMVGWSSFTTVAPTVVAKIRERWL